MKYFTAICICALQALVVTSLPATSPIHKPDFNLLRRNTRSTDGHIGCIHMESFPGQLSYVSDGTQDTCGLYLISEPDQLIEVTFVDFDVKCETGGLLAVFDGWELQGEIFPGPYEHQNDLSERYSMFCGENSPKKIFLSNQNAALIQFRIPQPGEGFRVLVNFKHNPQPCNAVGLFDNGILTMKNYGMRRNCTTAIIYPESVHLLNVDVGVTSDKKPFEAEVGISDKCMNLAGGDYVQFMDGNGLDSSMMSTKGIVCGMDSNRGKKSNIVLGCQNSVIKMVSSGEYYNTVTFKYSPPAATELSDTDMC